MNVLITLLSIGEKYSISCKLLVEELLSNTPFSILISTDNIQYFPTYKERVTVRQNIEEEALRSYGSEFNYNLKYHAFKNIPEGYDVVLYLDCDMKSKFWNESSTQLLGEIFANKEFLGCRFNCTLKTELEQLEKTGKCLFEHKINSYKVKTWKDSSILNSKLPSEHIFGFKYNKVKLEAFYNKWRELNYILQQEPTKHQSWGDGFEIGIAAYTAGYTEVYDVEYGIQQTVLGFQFNGNKI